MHFTTLISSLLLAAAALGAAPPQPQARSNAEAIARGLPLLKARVCDAECKANRIARRSKPSHTSLPDVSVQFRKTCQNNWFLDYDSSGPDLIMRAICKDSEGTYHSSELSLNSCIGVNKGTMTCIPGGFMSTGGCVDCTVDGETLNCMCPNSKNQLSKASVNLNSCIGNLEGQLYCNKHTDH
ncbi:hypothetical protein CspHIS471_0303700 [Cutaneotrichosporon sp. HIS471]|nr:hypothetical protein CspHIS471_0303700 [Cutaneotrichosporon sp. HIS471]